MRSILIASILIVTCSGIAHADDKKAIPVPSIEGADRTKEPCVSPCLRKESTVASRTQDERFENVPLLPSRRSRGFGN